MARLNSRRLMTLALVVAVTALAYMLLYYWTPVPMQLAGSFLGGAENDTRTIKEVWPVRIIQPSWLPQTEELLLALGNGRDESPGNRCRRAMALPRHDCDFRRS